MRKLETLLLLSPELAAEERQSLVDSFSAIIEREGGKVELVDDWGLRDLAYAVNKKTRGYYVRLEYVGPGALVAELERNIRITDGVYKFVTVRLADKAVEEEA